MIINSQRTIYASAIQMAAITGSKYTILPNTTLNEKYTIDANVTGVSDNPSSYTLNYFAIGIGGGNTIQNVSGYSYSQHSATDAALYEQIPFVMRETSSDLSITEQSNYRFRKTITAGGVDYYAYYLKKIPSIENKQVLHKISTKNNNYILSVLDTNNTTFLNPVPKDKTVQIDKFTKSEYVVKTTKVNFTLSVDDMKDIESVLGILYPNTKKNLTELALCTGIDDGAAQALCVQPAYFITMDIDTSAHVNSSESYTSNIDIGSMEPLL